MGCIDRATLTLKTPNGTWTDGEYALSIDVSDTVHGCTFQLPADLPRLGSVSTLACDPPLEVLIEPEVTCAETQTGDGVSQSCTPIADHYVVTATLPGTPAAVSVSVSRDGVEVSSTSQTLDYEAVQPNGPECGPACRVASLELTVTE